MTSRSFWAFIAASWASGIGSALATLACYATLYRDGASSSVYVLLFGASTVCGLAFPSLSVRWSERFSPEAAVASADLAACVTSAVVAVALAAGGPSEFVLVCAIAASANSAFRTPSMFAVLRERYSGEHEAFGFRLDQIGHGLAVLLGLGVGSFAAGRLEPSWLFAADALTFLASGLAASVLPRTGPSREATPDAPSVTTRAVVRSLSVERLLPPLILTVVMVPFMSLVPAIFDDARTSVTLFATVLIPSTLVQFSQGVGQIVGPLAHHVLRRTPNRRGRLLLGLVLATVAYPLAVHAGTGSIIAGLAFVAIAHVGSNVVFVDAWVGFTAGLSPLETSQSSAALYTLDVALTTAMLGLALLLSGAFGDRSSVMIFALLSAVCLVANAAVLSAQRRRATEAASAPVVEW